MAEKKPDVIVKAKLKKRAEKAMLKRKQPSPSQKRSENERIRERRRASNHSKSCIQAASDLIFDCYICPRQPCDVNPVACSEVMILSRCSNCGLPIRHYHDKVVAWSHCKTCREKVKS